ncbi:MAG: hypothetical protein K2Y32_07610 [Candidatus Obscuribacterales bacterium]|nr:hypothetical protein [Candidatus Obscuribacterales bacterium]
MNPPRSNCRLHILLARDSSEAVIIKRGPSKQVQLIAWQRDTDKFAPGQWFNGRIYERRCDLSPSGKYLLYFAASHKPPLYSWTAVSRPPFLTALALWPKGDCWGGGGLFIREREIYLNHPSHQMDLAEKNSLPKQVKVARLNEQAGGGEDFPIYHLRLLRDGWRTVDNQESLPEEKINALYHSNLPIIYKKTRPTNARNRYEGANLSMSICGIAEPNNPWYIVEYQVEGSGGAVIKKLGRLDWADWDSNGDLLFAKTGRIFRSKDLIESTELVDLRTNLYQEIAAESWAKQW